MARHVRMTIVAAAIALVALTTHAQECSSTWNSCRIPGSHPPQIGWCCGQVGNVCTCENPLPFDPSSTTTTATPPLGGSEPSEVTTQAPYGSPETPAPYSSQPAEITTNAPYSSQPAEKTTAALYSSQPAEVTTAAPYASQPAEITTTGAPYTTSQPAEVTTAAPAYSSQPAEVTTSAPYASTTAAPYSSQPAEVTTAAPYGSQPAEVTTAAPTTAAPYSTTAAPSYTTSQPAEVTTAAPVTTTHSPYASSQPAEVTTGAPITAAPPGTCQWVYIDAQFVLSGAGWTKVRNSSNAWASLSGAVTSDLAFLLGRVANDITIESIAVRSLTASSDGLTIAYTVRSNALAEAARIAALIRDDIPATAPLPATDGVYASVGQTAADVTVVGHTGQSRDTYDCDGSASSSSANEVTTAAPASVPYENPTPYSPAPSYWPVYASVILGGDGWQQFAASAWNALKAAVLSDIAAALHVDKESVTINVIQAAATGLRVNYTVMAETVQEASQISLAAAQLDNALLALPSTIPLYNAADPSAQNVTVTSAWASPMLQDAYSPSRGYQSWSVWIATAAVVVAFAALRE